MDVERNLINNRLSTFQNDYKKYIYISIILILLIIIIILICYIIFAKKESNYNNDSKTINNIKNIYSNNMNVMYDDEFKNAIIRYYNKYINKNSEEQKIFEIARSRITSLYNMNITDIIDYDRCGVKDNMKMMIIDEMCNDYDNIVNVYYRLNNCDNIRSREIQNSFKMYENYNIMFYNSEKNYNIDIYCNYNNNNFGFMYKKNNKIIINLKTKILSRLKYEMYHMLSHIFIYKHDFILNSYTFPYIEYYNDKNEIDEERIYMFKNNIRNCT
ncbi:hypothetical protein AMVITR05b [Betaentomopoxvirus amoorei]|uniref:AMVITR05 n=1 Tax=Amsacta moorei entomopoxvirus TaxID=28321 RepID=Q9DH93_AMEPV|nr:hypothetical protein AMVITR05a [Amsacta moorei entomopoxvirus]NP_065057.1 hypothetical protein AMVITR05b [Amsacta moorei entomopoxvirus]AAG02977.1 AMVITR05 [Amsacta moorei entomopoxvirus]AAG02988.1 AMVITR05 [Amsacta moorei entomopoxvirus]